MERKEFISLSAKAGAGLLIPSLIAQQACNIKGKNVREIIYTVITEVATYFIEGCSYTVCMAGVKNPLICNLVSTAMGEATGFIAKKITGKKNGTHDVGHRRKASWSIETRNRGVDNILKVYYTLSVIDDTVDLLRTLGCPGGSCGGKSMNWEYVGLFGTGQYAYLSEQFASENDIARMDVFTRCIMRNEMFARHGYRFHQNPRVMDYFQSQDWYLHFPQNLRHFDAGYVQQHYFNDYERYNLNLILQFPNKC
jgi:hypothetical protein